jgi:hypothetical protein
MCNTIPVWYQLSETVDVMWYSKMYRMIYQRDICILTKLPSLLVMSIFAAIKYLSNI